MSKNKEESPVVSSDADKFTVRFPGGMRDRIAQESRSNGRSMNTEIIARLAASFESEENGNRELMAMLEREFAELRRELAKTQEMIAAKN